VSVKGAGMLRVRVRSRETADYRRAHLRGPANPAEADWRRVAAARARATARRRLRVSVRDSASGCPLSPCVLREGRPTLPCV
jgi:hypothetical protein